MPNTNYQTFHQMGQAINEVVKQATGWKPVQNIDMDHVTVAQTHYYHETVTVGGEIASFIDSAGGIPLEKCIAYIEPVQEGSGNPSPDNVRPITGRTSVNIVVSPTADAQDGTTYTITLSDEAGTVYGGILDVTAGLLTVNRAIVVLDGGEYWRAASNPMAQFISVSAFPGVNLNAYEEVICSHLKMISTVPSIRLSIGEACYNSDRSQLLLNLGCNSVADLRTYLASNPVTVTYPLETPITYQLTPTEIITLTGQNNIWADTGDIEVQYIKL